MRTPGAVVAKNVGEIRRSRGLTVRDLAARLAELGHRLLASGVSRIENGERRVDVDDLVALARALDVSPVRLLLPAEPGEVALPGDDRAWPWQAVWRWAVGEQPLTREPMPLTDPRVAEFIRANRPFEDPAPARELARWVVARVPAPVTAHVEVDAAGRARPRIEWGDIEWDGDGDGEAVHAGR